MVCCGSSSGQALPTLAVIGEPEIVWNQSRDACPGFNRFGHVGEYPDSMFAAWYNPTQNQSYIIASTSWGTYASVGKRLDELHHDCSDYVYKAYNLTYPWTYLNHQWLQAVRVRPDGTGAALIHNEFHAEQAPHNLSWCTHNRTDNPNHECIYWSSDLGATINGGESWNWTEAPLFALPRYYFLDAPQEGYGAIGQILEKGNFHFGHVSRICAEGTGACAPGRAGEGICAWRATDVSDASSFRFWNGSAYSVYSINPYEQPVPKPSDLDAYTCQPLDFGYDTMHFSARRLAGEWVPKDWPTYVAAAWPTPENGDTVAISALSAGGDEGEGAFTRWEQWPRLNLSGWSDPHTLAGLGSYMYPSLIDHDSPFSLSDWAKRTASSSGSSAVDAAASDGLSYGLVGNSSLYLYAVYRRAYWVRFPVAWMPPGVSPPTPPYPPVPPVNASCYRLLVEGAGVAGVNGVYEQTGASAWQLDAEHQLYRVCASPRGQGSRRETPECHWTMAHQGHPPEYYQAELVAGKSYAGKVPGQGWSPMGGVFPVPTVSCATEGE